MLEVFFFCFTRLVELVKSWSLAELIYCARNWEESEKCIPQNRVFMVGGYFLAEFFYNFFHATGFQMGSEILNPSNITFTPRRGLKSTKTEHHIDLVNS